VIPCKDAVSRLWEYLDRNIARVRETELEEHLGVCRHCCGELEFARQLRGLLKRSNDACEATPEVRARLDGFVKDLAGRRRERR
jgi:anti-sigma factor (TIGR02949 family)